jgi:hypothetical protein
MCYLAGMDAKQVNLRLPAELLAEVERVRGRTPRNTFLTSAVQRALADYEPPTPIETRPTSVRAPKGCRVVGVPAEARGL